MRLLTQDPDLPCAVKGLAAITQPAAKTPKLTVQQQCDIGKAYDSAGLGAAARKTYQAALKSAVQNGGDQRCAKRGLELSYATRVGNWTHRCKQKTFGRKTSREPCERLKGV